MFILLLFFAGVLLFGGLCEGPVWVTTCLEHHFKVFLFSFFLGLWWVFLRPYVVGFRLHPACVLVSGVCQKGGIDPCE